MKRKTKLLFLASAIMLGTSVSALAVIKTNVAQAQGTNVFEMVDGASIRTIDPTGIRFKTKMSENYYEQLTAENSTSELHVVVIPYAYYQAYQADTTENKGALYPWLVEEYTADGILDLEIPAEKLYEQTKDGETYYYANAVMSNVYFNNYNVDFVGVAYIQNGTNYQDVTNITEKDNVRSIFEVAYKAAADPIEYAAHGAFLDQLIEKGLYNAYGLKVDKSTDKFVYGDASYETYEEAVTALNLDVLDDTTLSINETIDWILSAEEKTFTATLSFSDGKTYNGDAALVWSSSNEDVAIVDENGKVTPKSVGTTNITVSAIGGKFKTTKALTVKDMNVFHGEAVLDGNQADSGHRIEKAWNKDDLGWDVTIKDTLSQIAQTANWFSVPLDEVKRMVEMGKTYARFEVQADEKFFEGGAPIIGVYANRAGDVRCSNTNPPVHEGALHNVVPRSTISDAWSLYKGTLSESNKWTTIMLDLTKIADIEATNGCVATRLTIALGGNAGSVIKFRSFTAMTAEEYNQSYYTSVNLMGAGHTFEAYTITMAYDEAEGAIKATNTQAGFAVPNARLRSSAVLTTIRKAKEAGMTHLTFQYKADSAFVNSKNVGNQQPTNYFNIYMGIGSKWTAPNNYFVQTVTATTADAWTSVEIDLTSDTVTALLNDTKNTHFAFILGGDIGSIVYFRNMTFVKK